MYLIELEGVFKFDIISGSKFSNTFPKCFQVKDRHSIHEMDSTHLYQKLCMKEWTDLFSVS